MKSHELPNIKYSDSIPPARTATTDQTPLTPSASSSLDLYLGVLSDCCKEMGSCLVKAGAVCCIVSTVLTLSLCLTLIDDKLDQNCDNYKITNEAGSSLYFDSNRIGVVWDGYSFHLEIPHNATASYPFTFYTDYLERKNCILKIRPKHSNSNEPPVEVTGCSVPNAFDSGVCLYDIKDKTDRRLRGQPESTNTDKTVYSSSSIIGTNLFSLFTPQNNYASELDTKQVATFSM
jgi:hypothetical protein